LGAFVFPFLAHAQEPAVPPRFATGVVTTIPPDFAPEETASTHDIVEIRANPELSWKPEYLTESRTLYGMSQGVKFRHDIWCLEFSFKPLRMIEVSVPHPSRGTERRLVWYLAYKIRNTGRVLKPVGSENGVFTAEFGKGDPDRFVPRFILESHDRSPAGERLSKQYLDRVIPAALEKIRQREMRGGELLTSTEMAEQIIPVGGGRADHGLWGVAMWEGIDPRIDFFSIYVGGLTNAYRWADPPGAYRPGDPPGKGRQFERKMLQLNFWRPGDELRQDEREIRFGVPVDKAGLYDVPPGVAYRWVYR
jgi:hypothetical protein